MLTLTLILPETFAIMLALVLADEIATPLDKSFCHRNYQSYRIVYSTTKICPRKLTVPMIKASLVTSCKMGLQDV